MLNFIPVKQTSSANSSSEIWCRVLYWGPICDAFCYMEILMTGLSKHVNMEWIRYVICLVSYVSKSILWIKCFTDDLNSCFKSRRFCFVSGGDNITVGGPMKTSFQALIGLFTSSGLPHFISGFWVFMWYKSKSVGVLQVPTLSLAKQTKSYKAALSDSLKTAMARFPGF